MTEITPITSCKDLPMGVQMVEYSPPYYGDALQEVISQFRQKYGEPGAIYRLGNRFWVVMEDKNG